MCFGGGGSSGSSGGNDTLWNAQAASAQQNSAMSGEMFDYWKQYAPGYLSNANAMATEATDGTLTARARATAGADADQATSSGIASANRSLERYGATINPNSMAHDTKSAALAGAATKAGVMSKATEWGEGQKWARNQDAFGMSSGMPGNAVASANSANAGYGALASMQNNADRTSAANAAGYGTMGATLASSMFKADGGIVRHFASGGIARRNGGSRTVRAVRNGVRLASGGIPKNPVVGWRDRVAAMPSIEKTDNSSSPVANMVSGALPTVASEITKPYLKEGLSAVKDGIKGVFSTADTGAGITGGIDVSGLANAADAGIAANAAEVGAGGANLAAGALDTGLSAASTGAATTAAAASAAEVGAGAASLASGAGAASSAGAAAALASNPAGWAIGAGLALASLFGSGRADGGDIDRKDMTPGGAVSGKGTETSDSIAAWLSDKEYVLNSEAVKIAGKGVLDQLNEAGLKKRHGDQAVMVDGEAKPNGLASGGMLGVAMGAGADTFNRLQQEKKRNEQIDAEIAMRQQTAAQQATQFEWAKLDQAEKTRIRDEGNAIMSKYKPRFEAMNKGDYSSFVGEFVNDYNGNSGGLNDGHTAAVQSTPQGSVINFSDKNGQLVRSQPINPQFVKQATQMAMLSELSAISPELMQRAMNHDLEARKVAATEKTADSHLLSTKNMGEHLVRSDANADGNLELGRARLSIAQGGLELSQNADARAKADFDAGASDRELRSTVGTLRVRLANATTDEEKSAISAKLQAIQSGFGPDKGAPAEVKLAAALVRAGVVKTEAEGLKYALHNKDASPEKIRADIYSNALKTGFNDTKKANEVANQAMKDLGYDKPTAAPTAADITATAKKYGVSEDEVKKRLGIK